MQLARFLNKIFKKGGFILVDANSKEYIIGEPKNNSIKLKILNKNLHYKLLFHPDLYFGEAYTDGEIIIENGSLYLIKVNVDTLTLTATPIPRTLQFSLMAARDLSVIRTPPPNRQPIHTEVRVFNDKVIKESIYYEVNRGGQVFIVHNRVKSLMDIATMIKKLCKTHLNFLCHAVIINTRYRGPSPYPNFNTAHFITAVFQHYY